MIEKEIAVHLLAYNLVRWTMASAAWLGDVLPRCLSFTSAKRVLLAFDEQLRHCGGKRLSRVRHGAGGHRRLENSSSPWPV
ncbi:MAG: hypothetical protein IPJ50_02610 [Betaproteobacteria bacterium]|nr:hypothetical protein [Betaproteobacteria bacterium]